MTTESEWSAESRTATAARGPLGERGEACKSTRDRRWAADAAGRLYLARIPKFARVVGGT